MFVRLAFKRRDFWLLAPPIPISPSPLAAIPAAIIFVDRRNCGFWTLGFRHDLRNYGRYRDCRCFNSFFNNGWRCRNSGRGGSARLCSSTFLELGDLVFDTRDNLLVLLSVLKKIRNVKECIPFETDIDEGGLHPWQYFRYFALINVTNDTLRAMAFYVKFNEFVVFEDRNFSLLRCGGND